MRCSAIEEEVYYVDHRIKHLSFRNRRGFTQPIFQTRRGRRDTSLHYKGAQSLCKG